MVSLPPETGYECIAMRIGRRTTIGVRLISQSNEAYKIRMKSTVNKFLTGRSLLAGVCLAFVSALCMPVWGQTEVKTTIRLVDPGWKAEYTTDNPDAFVTQTAREGKKQTAMYANYGVRFEQIVTDQGDGMNKMLVVLYADSTRWIEGAFYCIELSAATYGNGAVVMDSAQVNIGDVTSADPKKSLIYKSKLLRVDGNGCGLELSFRRTIPLFICKNATGNAVIYLSLTDGKRLMAGNSLQHHFTMRSTDRTTPPVAIAASEPEKAQQPQLTPVAVDKTATVVPEVKEEKAAPEPEKTPPLPERTVPSVRTERTGGYAIATASDSNAQTEVMAWGNMTGIRVNGELMAFESSFRLAEPGWEHIHATGKERQAYPVYTRNDRQQTVATHIKKIRYEQVVTDTGTGRNNVSLTVRPDTTIQAEGTFFCIELPADRYADGSVSVNNTRLPLGGLHDGDPEKADRYRGTRIQVNGTGRTLKLEFRSTATIFLCKETTGNVVLYIGLMPGKTLTKGTTHQCQFSMEATGEIDNERVEIAIDRTQPGRLFDGLGGNFRLQNPRQDPKVINYCLENMRVAWGRVEMPWRNWQPYEYADPIADARSGKINERVSGAMKMAQRLQAMGMPVIVSAWFPPEWAILGNPANYANRGGVIAYQLDPRKKEKIYKSITDYLVYLKQEYGVEAAMYSFNESDLGIDVLFTPKEHAAFIKELGAYMASRGLSTKLLLGDNSDATTFDFIVPAMEDPETYPFIGAVSFHSWRGCDDATLRKWADASRRLNVPLIVGEGSTDAAAWRYPQIFGESTFALYEINLYMRICAICQPLSILQWQLTSDYSLLLGDGLFGTDGPLRRTQRYWNLKQLASTPGQSFALPFTCSKPQVNTAAFANIARGEYTIHMVNNGASRPAVVKGLPEKTADVKVYVTTSDKGMEEVRNVVLNRGTITFELPATSFATVIATP